MQVREADDVERLPADVVSIGRRAVECPSARCVFAGQRAADRAVADDRFDVVEAQRDVQFGPIETVHVGVRQRDRVDRRPLQNVGSDRAVEAASQRRVDVEDVIARSAIERFRGRSRDVERIDRTATDQRFDAGEVQNLTCQVAGIRVGRRAIQIPSAARREVAAGQSIDPAGTADDRRDVVEAARQRGGSLEAVDRADGGQNHRDRTRRCAVVHRRARSAVDDPRHRTTDEEVDDIRTRFGVDVAGQDARQIDDVRSVVAKQIEGHVRGDVERIDQRLAMQIGEVVEADTVAAARVSRRQAERPSADGVETRQRTADRAVAVDLLDVAEAAADARFGSARAGDSDRRQCDRVDLRTRQRVAGRVPFAVHAAGQRRVNHEAVVACSATQIERAGAGKRDREGVVRRATLQRREAGEVQAVDADGVLRRAIESPRAVHVLTGQRAAGAVQSFDVVKRSDDAVFRSVEAAEIGERQHGVIDRRPLQRVAVRLTVDRARHRRPIDVEDIVAAAAQQVGVRIDRDGVGIDGRSTLQSLEVREEQYLHGSTAGVGQAGRAQGPRRSADQAGSGQRIRVVRRAAADRIDVVEAAGSGGRALVAVERSRVRQHDGDRSRVQAEVQLGTRAAVDQSRHRTASIDVDVIEARAGRDRSGQRGTDVEDVSRSRSAQIGRRGARHVKRVDPRVAGQVREVADVQREADCAVGLSDTQSPHAVRRLSGERAAHSAAEQSFDVRDPQRDARFRDIKTGHVGIHHESIVDLRPLDRVASRFAVEAAGQRRVDRERVRSRTTEDVERARSRDVEVVDLDIPLQRAEASDADGVRAVGVRRGRTIQRPSAGCHILARERSAAARDVVDVVKTGRDVRFRSRNTVGAARTSDRNIVDPAPLQSVRAALAINAASQRRADVEHVAAAATLQRDGAGVRDRDIERVGRAATGQRGESGQRQAGSATAARRRVAVGQRGRRVEAPSAGCIAADDATSGGAVDRIDTRESAADRTFGAAVTVRDRSGRERHRVDGSALQRVKSAAAGQCRRHGHRDGERVRCRTTGEILDVREVQRARHGNIFVGARRAGWSPRRGIVRTGQRIGTHAARQRGDVVERPADPRRRSLIAVDRTVRGQDDRDWPSHRAVVQLGTRSTINVAHDRSGSGQEVDVIVPHFGRDVAGQCGRQIHDVVRRSAEQVKATGAGKRDVERIDGRIALQVREAAEVEVVRSHRVGRRTVEAPCAGDVLSGQRARSRTVAGDRFDVVEAGRDIRFCAVCAARIQIRDRDEIDSRPTQRVTDRMSLPIDAAGQYRGGRDIKDVVTRATIQARGRVASDVERVVGSVTLQSPEAVEAQREHTRRVGRTRAVDCPCRTRVSDRFCQRTTDRSVTNHRVDVAEAAGDVTFRAGEAIRAGAGERDLIDQRAGQHIDATLPINAFRERRVDIERVRRRTADQRIEGRECQVAASSAAERVAVGLRDSNRPSADHIAARQRRRSRAGDHVDAAEAATDAPFGSRVTVRIRGRGQHDRVDRRTLQRIDSAVAGKSRRRAHGNHERICSRAADPVFDAGEGQARSAAGIRAVAAARRGPSTRRSSAQSVGQ